MCLRRALVPQPSIGTPSMHVHAAACPCCMTVCVCAWCEGKNTDIPQIFDLRWEILSALNLPGMPGRATFLPSRITVRRAPVQLRRSRLLPRQTCTRGLIELAASALARAHWRSSGARTEADAKSVWVACCRRRIGVAVARADARFRLRRAVFVGVPRAVLDDGTPRGLAAMAAARATNGVAAHAEVDLHALYAHQVTVRVNAD